MYTEEYEKRGFPIRGVLGVLFFSALLVAMVWFATRYYKNMKNEKSVEEEMSVIETSPVMQNEHLGEERAVSQVFIDNIRTFKKVALSYYKGDRLPKSFGDTSKLTLNDMISLRLLVPLVDQNQQEYNREESFVQITNLGEEYLMRVYLKGEEEENYIWVYIGDYDYCGEFGYKNRNSF